MTKFGERSFVAEIFKINSNERTRNSFIERCGLTQTEPKKCLDVKKFKEYRLISSIIQITIKIPQFPLTIEALKNFPKIFTSH